MRSIVVVGVLLASCNTIDQFSYTPPHTPPTSTPERVIPLPFDHVWSELIDSVGKAFFAIDNFEKDSGLLTLSFTTSPFSTAVTGGNVKVHFDDSSAAAGEAFWTGVSRPATTIRFDGDYADWVQQYLRGTFTGRMNIVVRQDSATSTRVTLNTRFIVTATTIQGAIVSTTSWAWNTGEAATQTVTDRKGERVQRTLQSTGFVEKKLLDQLDTLGASSKQ